MKQNLPFALLGLCLGLSAPLLGSGCATLRPDSDRVEPKHPVGVRSVEVVDESRGRQLTVEVWYPAAKGPEASERYMFFYRAGSAARDAEPAKPPPNGWPTVLLSHGSSGTRFDQAWLAEHLAARGFLVAATSHPGNDYDEFDPFVSLRIWERPQDLRVMLDHLLADATFSPLINKARIGAAGHSMGGYTALAVAGARYDVHRVRAHCKTTPTDPQCYLAPKVDRSKIDYGPSNDSYRDDRVRSVMVFAPAMAPGLDLSSVGDVTVPVHVVAGRKDELTPFQWHARQWATVLKADLTVLGNADHFTFVSPCLPVIKLWPWADACRDPSGFDRVPAQRRVAELAHAYFEKTL